MNNVASKDAAVHREVKVEKPRWWTIEFIIYYIIAIVIYGYMFMESAKLSSRKFLSSYALTLIFALLRKTKALFTLWLHVDFPLVGFPH